jgi:peptidoglycan/LPS O-acetylase OafA/YrhL
MTPDSIAAPGKASRLFDVDWLRVLATVLIFVFHTGRMFDTMEPWHIKNPQVTEALTYPMVFGSQFVMPLFWILSGVGTCFALRSHAAREYVRRRLSRLLVPLVTLGWFVLSPPQIYIERVTAQNYNTPPFSGTFWQYLPHYFEGFYGFGGNFAWNGMHLWYLFYLVVFTLLSLPLFLYMRGARGGKVVSALASFLSKPGAVFLMFLPVLVPEILIRRGTFVLGWVEGGWSLGAHWVFLLLGYFIASDARLRPAIQRHRWVALALAVLSLVPLVILGPQMESLPFGSMSFNLQWGLRTLNGWCWLVAILGFGSKHLNFANAALAYAGPAVLPFYILHQPVTVVLGYLLRDWPLVIGLKYPLMVVLAFGLCMLLYELLIRRIALLRFLFGIGPLRTRSQAGPGS